MNLASAGIRGAYFTSLALGFRQVFSLLTTFYVASRLLPADIGVFSLVMLVVGLAQAIGDIGISAGLVRTQKNSAVTLSTCFWVSAAIGAMLSIALVVLTPVASWFYQKPAIEPYLRVSAVGLLLNFMTPVPMAILQQRLAYREIAISQGLGSLAGAVTTIGLVTAGFGIWGLVFQPIIGNLCIWCLLVFYAKWLPTLQFQLASARDVLLHGVHLLGSGITSYLRNTLDIIIIGRALSAKDLGEYGMAQTILYSPMHLISSTISRVIFPLLAKVQNDLDKVRSAVLKATSWTALLVFPLYSGLVVLADEFVLHVFGPNWTGLVVLIRIMAISFIIQSIGNVSGPLMIALGRTKTVFKLSVAGALLYFAVVLALIPYGLKAVAIGYAVANSVVGLTTMIVALRCAQMPLSEFLMTLAKPALFALLMCVAIVLVQTALDPTAVLSFVVMLTVGAATYVALIYRFEESAWRQVLGALISRKVA